ncbi:endonuclease Q family protein [Brevibacillus sp. Leaf182]|uniref:endonuclease Q family protein n=1 Tax=Brevibacillus sp. Leaf182 TaxID=1736290 RepID=UPI0006FADBC0|nr:endonuclease Q family protein [Brevibacillus sp. Leaf182]RAT95177.1 TIGR00375 family protein [Brevibacillus sp. Leaf182]
MLSSYFCDMHIHIGGTWTGKPVKITASRQMTLTKILEEASDKKGMDVIGIIDAHSPEVQDELVDLLEKGLATELVDGGISYKDTLLILGCEVEIKEPGRGAAHFLVYLPKLQEMKQFTAWLSERCKNVQLSSQRIYTSLRELQACVDQLQGILIPAHVFTPHKGLYGSCTDSMAEVLDPSLIYAVELGLSANTIMADRISELHDKTFLTNSDAHSLAKIGREYQSMYMQERSFAEWVKAIKRIEGRGVRMNYGLHPELGKYHQTACQGCQSLLAADASGKCPECGFQRIVRGVAARIDQLADVEAGQHPAFRPPYIEQIPLEFIPGVGPKLLDKLYQSFGTQMNVLHRVNEEQLTRVVGEKIASLIVQAREGKLSVQKGGAGTYGKIVPM